MRYLILIHRYLGIAIGVVMVGWCLTGIVMMYVRYPQLSQSERLQRLTPLDWQACCALGTAALPADAPIEAFQIESLTGRPVLQVQFANSSRRLIDLIRGGAITEISQRRATEVAKDGAARTPRLLGVIDYDEWTVSGEFNRARPLYRFALDDAAGSQIYVSAKTGRLVQVTTAHQRFWNWLGAVPHWLYFAQLRHQPRLWTQVVIWTSVAGCFLTVFGIYLGVRQFLRRPAGRWSGYRGLLYWHHVPGLVFGLFALTWVASGLISMNPWGFLDSSDEAPGVDEMIGQPLVAAQVTQSLQALASAPPAHDVVSVQSVRLWGQLYLIATRADGSRQRLDAGGHPAPLRDSDWQRIGRALGGTTDAKPDLMVEGDTFYHSRPGVPAQLPVYRIVLGNEQRTRLYLDPLTGTPLAVIDDAGRWYRWLHVGLHTLDFSAAIRSRPVWDLIMLALLAGVTFVCATGTWLGWRRYLRLRP